MPVYVLGPEPVISEQVLDRSRRIGTEPKRIGEDDAVSNSIAFARYTDGDFGWNVTDPGHGLVLANATRPADAGAAAPLSASGKWGPLLLTDNADVLPAPLEGYLLDIKPGYVDDPTRAVYNHAWLIGDTTRSRSTSRPRSTSCSSSPKYSPAAARTSARPDRASRVPARHRRQP